MLSERGVTGASRPAGTRTFGSVVVVGAGAFGGWTPLHLRRRGLRVTLVDAWGPGNSRASSGGETRIIRGTYGPDKIYTHLVARALTLWRENQKRWNLDLYHPLGVLWMAPPEDAYEQASLTALREAGLAFDKLSPEDLKKRWPQINFEGIRWAILEKDAGYLEARRACEAVLSGFVAEGGEYIRRSAAPGAMERGAMHDIALSDGRRLSADVFVFACGPWLGHIFPDVLGPLIHPTRQEVFFFGTPEGDPRFTEEGVPVWIDHGPSAFYGIPGNQWRGFKLACDTRGPAFDPTTGERLASAQALRAATDYLAFRFPGMKGAPLSESRVCQYEQSRDGHFILDRHPEAANVWLAGGGSGHGFKHGPALGEMLSKMVLGEKPLQPFFALERFRNS